MIIIYIFIDYFCIDLPITVSFDWNIPVRSAGSSERSRENGACKPSYQIADVKYFIVSYLYHMNEITTENIIQDIPVLSALQRDWSTVMNGVALHCTSVSWVVISWLIWKLSDQ